MFDDPNLVASAGLVPMMGLAQQAGLEELARQHLSVPGDKGANAGLKVASLVGGMVAGADSIDDMALLRHGGMGRLFAAIYAPSTLGSFLRAFAFGHVRQLDAVASRFLVALTDLARLGTTKPTPAPADAGRGGFAFVDVDDTVIEVHGHAKQGAGFGYTKVRGLNALLATMTGPARQRDRRHEEAGCVRPVGLHVRNVPLRPVPTSKIKVGKTAPTNSIEGSGPETILIVESNFLHRSPYDSGSHTPTPRSSTSSSAPTSHGYATVRLWMNNHVKSAERTVVCSATIWSRNFDPR